MKNNTILISLCFVFFIFSLSGCSYIPDAYIEKSKAQKTLEFELAKRDSDSALALAKVGAAKDAELEQVNDNFQETANELFAAHIALDVETTKSRPVLIADTHVTAAAAFAPKPTLESVLKSQELLKKELDTQKVSNADITTRLNNTLSLAAQAQEDLKQKDLAIKLAIEEKEKLFAQDSAEIEAAQQKLNDVNNKVIAGQEESLKDKAARNKERMWLIGIFTFVGVALGLAAIFSPVLKNQFALGSGAALVISIGIVLVPQWIITTFACIVFLTLFGWTLYEVLLSHKAASNTYRALQEVKVSDAPTYDKLKPILASWQTKYDTDGKLIPDTATVAHIDTVLKKTDSL